MVNLEFMGKLDRNRRAAEFRRKRLGLRAARLRANKARGPPTDREIRMVMVSVPGTVGESPLEPRVYRNLMDSILKDKMGIGPLKRDIKALLLREPAIQKKLRAEGKDPEEVMWQ